MGITHVLAVMCSGKRDSSLHGQLPAGPAVGLPHAVLSQEVHKRHAWRSAAGPGLSTLRPPVRARARALHPGHAEPQQVSIFQPVICLRHCKSIPE